jgi:MbtH protein
LTTFRSIEERIMTNPFEDPNATYLVLRNAEGQHSLWPVFATLPEGWETVFGGASRQECLDFVECSWTDMRPTSLVKAMEGHR